jgi:hypothetical protein
LEERAMKISLRIVLAVLVYTIFIFSPLRAEDHRPARPGTLNYVEGRAYLGSESLDAKSVGSAELDPGQTISTQNGKVEILLTPGVFVRLGEHGAATMIVSGLTHTHLSIDAGEAFVEVAEIHPENDLQIVEDGKSTELRKVGLYDFNADRHLVQVLDGKVSVNEGNRHVDIKSGHMLNLENADTLKTKKFDKKVLEAEDLYRWTSLRSGYLAEANADEAPGYSFGGSGWYGDGWYWDPWFDAYTFLPADGIFYSPFGWGFYSPWYAFGAFGWGGYGRYGYGHYFHHFNSAYGAASAVNGHYGMPANYGRGVHYGSRGGVGYSARGFRSSGGFHGGGGGFHGGGFGGGGFHGGGGGSHGGGGHR